MRTSPLAALLGAAAMILSGCGSEIAVDPGPAFGDLDGAAYVATAITEDGSPKELPGTLEITFGGGRMGIQGGCNTISGGYRVDDDALVVEELQQTDMGCDAPLMEQDAWAVGLFAEPVPFTQDGETLTLTAGATVVELGPREAAAATPALTDTRWLLDSIGDAGPAGPDDPDASVSSVPEGVEATLLIDGDGSVEVQTGCNAGFGSVTINRDVLAFGPLATTRRGCVGPAEEVEKAVLATLDGEVGFEVTDQTLSLTKDDRRLSWRVAAED